MTRGRYYLVWFELLLRGMLVLGLDFWLESWAGVVPAKYLAAAWIGIALMYCVVMLPFAVNFAVTGRLTLLSSILLSTFLSTIFPAIFVVNGLVGALRGGWWPDLSLAAEHLGAGLATGLLMGITFWASGFLFPWNWHRQSSRQQT